MKIAVAYEDGQVFQHFGHTKQFKIYTVEGVAVEGSAMADPSGSGHSALAGFLVGRGVDALICGGIGMGARNALAEAGIRLYAALRAPPMKRRPLWRQGPCRQWTPPHVTIITRVKRTSAIATATTAAATVGTTTKME